MIEAPFLSFHEAMIYTRLDRINLDDLLAFARLPREHIDRSKLDRARERIADHKHRFRRERY